MWRIRFTIIFNVKVKSGHFRETQISNIKCMNNHYVLMPIEVSYLRAQEIVI